MDLLSHIEIKIGFEYFGSADSREIEDVQKIDFILVSNIPEEKLSTNKIISLP